VTRGAGASHRVKLSKQSLATGRERALPEHFYAPARRMESGLIPLVPFDVAVELVIPELFIRCRPPAARTIVPMPKAAVH
jgi:hypothetical protein